MTIDLVTNDTFLSPFADSFPFLHGNAIVGYAYYVRLLEGSANGLAMIPLEHTEESIADDLVFLNGFYGDSSGEFREEIDVGGRTCAAARTQDTDAGGCTAASDGDFDRIRARIFGSPALNASSRVIVFTWNTDRPSEGGPSAICEANPGLGCARLYNFRRFNGDGSTANSGVLRLDHVVNIITPTGPQTSGQFVIDNVPDPGTSMQTYAFSFNSASPPGNPDLNWDAILEGTVQP